MAKVIEKTIPTSPPVRKPTVKKSFSMNDYKKKVNAEDIPDKPLEWIKISDALESVTGLPGFPKGYVSTCPGFSNTGKSTAIALGIVNAQKMGLLPIIIDCENNLSKYRLSQMGFDWDGDYITIDNEYLLEKFGKPSDKNREQASIEDLANCIRFFLKEQEIGNLPRELAFAIDSIGTLNCNKTIAARAKSSTDGTENSDKDNNMWNALAYEKEFLYLFNDVIPNSRKINSEFTNTVMGVQKIGRDNINNVITMKGGRIWEYTPRLQYYFGGVLTKGVKRITATSKKREVAYGVEVKVQVLKNHIDGPLGGLSMDGKIISVPQGFILPDKLDEYKKENILFFRNLFGENIDIEDIEDGVKVDEKGEE